MTLAGEPQTFAIDDVYVFIAERDGVEGVPATRQKGLDGQVMLLPMVCTEVSQIADYKPIAEKMAEQMGPIRLVRFGRAETIEVLGEVAEEEAPPPVVVHCLGGCGQRLFNEMIERGYCRGCVPKDDDLPISGSRA